MLLPNPSKAQVIELLRRFGHEDRVAQAELELPDPVDLGRDEQILRRLGLGVDVVIDAFGGSAL